MTNVLFWYRIKRTSFSLLTALLLPSGALAPHENGQISPIISHAQFFVKVTTVPNYYQGWWRAMFQYSSQVTLSEWPSCQTEHLDFVIRTATLLPRWKKCQAVADVFMFLQLSNSFCSAGIQSDQFYGGRRCCLEPIQTFRDDLVQSGSIWFKNKLDFIQSPSSPEELTLHKKQLLRTVVTTQVEVS